MRLLQRLARVSFLVPVLIAAIFASMLLAYTAYAASNGYAGSNGSADNGTFSTNLSGGQEVPSVSTNTTGSSTVSFGSNGANMHLSLSVFNGDEIRQAHLHCGDPGENGPAIVTLFEDSSGADVNGSLVSRDIGNANIADTDCTSQIGYDIIDIDDLASAIDDGRIYVNVHSEQYPNGVARGQFDGDNDDEDDSDNGYGNDDSDDEYNGGGHGSDSRHDEHRDHSDKKHSDSSYDDEHSNSHDESEHDRWNDGHHDNKWNDSDGKDEDWDRRSSNDHKEWSDSNDWNDEQDGKDGKGGKGGRDGDDWKDDDDGDRGQSWNHGSSLGSSARASVRSFISANSNLRVNLR